MGTAEEKVKAASDQAMDSVKSKGDEVKTQAEGVEAGAEEAAEKMIPKTPAKSG